MLPLLLILLLLQESTPFKPKEEFELKMDYQFRQRPAPEVPTIEYGKKTTRSVGLLPYLGLELKFLKLHPEENRIKVIDNTGSVLLNKKLKPNMLVKLDLGFTDDMKDRISAYEYTISLSSDKSKQVASMIVIHVDEDGTFFVNGEKRGRL